MEQWRAVVGAEGLYEVSNQGRVRSLDRELECMGRHGLMVTKKYKGRVIKQHQHRGYMGVTLNSITPDKKVVFSNVHVLVAKAFLDKPDWADRVNHLDLDRSNNHVSNLEWTDHTGNIRHAVENGRQLGATGESNYNTILTEDDVRWIRKNAKTNGGTWTMRAMEDKYGMARGTITRVVHRHSWKHVK